QAPPNDDITVPLKTRCKRRIRRLLIVSFWRKHGAKAPVVSYVDVLNSSRSWTLLNRLLTALPESSHHIGIGQLGKSVIPLGDRVEPFRGGQAYALVHLGTQLFDSFACGDRNRKHNLLWRPFPDETHRGEHRRASRQSVI